MIFEHLFCDNFCYNFLSHTHIIFYFISVLLWFSCNTYFFFANYGCLHKLSIKSCSNNTPLKKMYALRWWGWEGDTQTRQDMMKFNSSSLLGMDMIISKYIEVECGDEEGKIRPHPTPLSCLIMSSWTSMTFEYLALIKFLLFTFSWCYDIYSLFSSSLPLYHIYQVTNELIYQSSIHFFF